MLSKLWLPIGYFAIYVVIVILFCWFVIRKKRKGIVVTIIVAVLMAAGGIVYCIPHNIIDADAEKISKIEISEIEVTDRETIKEILDDLNGMRYRRTIPSGIGGYEEYSVRGYDESGKLIFSIGIADEQTVDTGLFWEKCVSGKLNLSLYQDIIVETH